MLGRIGWMELVLILVLALIIFGPGKLPDVARAVGKSIKEFRKGTKEVIAEASIDDEDDDDEEETVSKKKRKKSS